MKSTGERAKPDIHALMEVCRQVGAAFKAFDDLFELQRKRVKLAARYDDRLHVLGGALQAEINEMMRIDAHRSRWRRKIRRAQDLETAPRIPGATHPVFGPVTQDLLREQDAIRRAIKTVELHARFEAESEMIDPGIRKEVCDLIGRINRMLVRWSAVPDAEASIEERSDTAAACLVQ